MSLQDSIIIILILLAIFFIGFIYIFIKYWGLKSYVSNKENEIIIKTKEMDSKMYELAILKELGERVGYSLDIHQIIEIITGSLHQFIDYSAVSYMLLDPEKVLFKIHLEKSVHRSFVDEVRDRMLKSLSALLDKDIKQDLVEELISGAILTSDLKNPVQSFFNIPLIVGGKVVGVLTVADTQSGLYKEEEMTILYKITNQASASVTRLQEVVKIEQSKLNAMVISMSDGIVMTDTDYRVLVANPAARRIINISQEKQVTIFDFIDNLGGIFDIRGKLEECVRFEKEFNSDRLMIGEKFFQIGVIPVKTTSVLGQEKISGAVVIFHDVTSEVEIETLRKDFTSMIVHELRSPLDGIKKIGELLKNKKINQTPESLDEYINLIYKNSSGMLELVNDILDVAKIEAGKFEVNKLDDDIVKTITERIEFYKIIANDSNISLELVLDDSIPEKVSFDKEGIEHVLSNLISNAIKYTNSYGTVKVSAFVHNPNSNIIKETQIIGINFNEKIILSNYESKSLVVLVTDSGTGIDENNINSIFSKFKQLDNNKTSRKKGTGLGLVIAKGIIEEHGGSIGVVSKINEGSTFYFSIPI